MTTFDWLVLVLSLGGAFLSGILFQRAAERRRYQKFANETARRVAEALKGGAKSPICATCSGDGRYMEDNCDGRGMLWYTCTTCMGTGRKVVRL